MNSTFRNICLVALSTQSLAAELITYDLRDPNGNGNDTANTAGEQFENGATSISASGVTLTLSATTTLGDGTAVYNADGTQGGLDSNGANSGNGGDVATAIDLGETFMLTWTFSAGTSLVLRSIDFAGVGNNTTEMDSALVAIGPAAPVRLGTGAADFNGTTDVWSPDLTINSGETFTFTAEESFSLQQIIVESFSTTPVPEPSTFAAIGIGLALLGGVRYCHRRASVSD